MQTNTTPIEFIVSYEVKETYADESEWLTALDDLYTLHKTAGWQFAEALNRGVKQFSSRYDRSAMYKMVNGQTGMSVSRLQNLVSMWNKPSSRVARDLGLEIAHAEAVLGLPEADAANLLTEAAERELSASAIGAIIRERKQVAPVMPPATHPADLPVVGNEDDEPPFARTQNNVLYDDTDSYYATDPSAYDESSDTEGYTYTGEEVMTIITKAMYRLRAQGYYEQQNTVRRWLQLIENQAY